MTHFPSIWLSIGMRMCFIKILRQDFAHSLFSKHNIFSMFGNCPNDCWSKDSYFAVGDKQFDLLVFYTQDRCMRDLGDSLRRFETWGTNLKGVLCGFVLGAICQLCKMARKIFEWNYTCLPNSWKQYFTKKMSACSTLYITQSRIWLIIDRLCQTCLLEINHVLCLVSVARMSKIFIPIFWPLQRFRKWKKMVNWNWKKSPFIEITLFHSTLITKMSSRNNTSCS